MIDPPPSTRNAPLDLAPETFRRLGHRLVDSLADFLDGWDDRPVARPGTPGEMRAHLPAGMPRTGADPGALLAEAFDLLADHGTFNGHPRFFGYITASPAPIGALAELLAAVMNPNCGGFQLSPMATEIERQTLAWIADLLGVPFGDGILVSGGNMANLTCFLAARRALARSGNSPENARPLVYASAETHTWLQKAQDLGTARVCEISTDDHQRIDIDALRARIAADRDAGEIPFLIVGTAGTVSTGAIDPIDALADIAQEHGVWLHVDAAYGGFAAAVPDQRPRFAGIERADSIATDPHKWLYAPIDAGCVLVRGERVLVDAFSHSPPYYRFDGDEADPRINFHERGLENSRAFRALKIWLALRQVGRDDYVAMIGEDIALARTLEIAVNDAPDFETGPGDLSICAFRYVPPELRGDAEALDALNEELLDRIQRSGETFLSNAMIGSRFYLRACVCNFRTQLADVLAVPAIVRRLGAAIRDS